MSSTRDIFTDSAEFVDTVARQLLGFLGERLERQAAVHLCLTGGSIAAKLYQRIGELDATAVAPDALDWGRVHFWWGDERWVPAGHADRNDAAAQQALGRVWERAVRHQMPASDGGLDLDAAAESYAEALGDRSFDLCLLGMGPDGHVASLFPDHPSARLSGTAIPVRESPKPPPERISVTFEVINRSDQVWLLVAGAEKAAAVADAQTPGSTLPAARVTGRTATVWKLDQAAAGS